MDLNLLTKIVRSLQIPLPLTPEGGERDDAKEGRRKEKRVEERKGKDNLQEERKIRGWKEDKKKKGGDYR